MIRIANYLYSSHNDASFLAFDEISDKGKIFSFITDGKCIWRSEDFPNNPDIRTNYTKCNITEIFAKLKEKHGDAPITKYLDSIKIA